MIEKNFKSWYLLESSASSLKPKVTLYQLLYRFLADNLYTFIRNIISGNSVNSADSTQCCHKLLL